MRTRDMITWLPESESVSLSTLLALVSTLAPEPKEKEENASERQWEKIT